MKTFLKSEIGAAVLWVVASVLLAAMVVPWLYQAGMWLASQAAAKNFPVVIEWFGAACGRAGLGRYFNRALLASSLLLLPLLLLRVRCKRTGADGRDAGALVSLPGWIVARHVIIGGVISGELLCMLVLCLDMTGAYQALPVAPGVWKIVSKAVVPAVVTALFEEWFFRGVLLGLWLRYAKPVAGIVVISLLFAFLHFLKPPEGVMIEDPAAVWSGFELLGKMLQHFTDPVFFITDFLTLAAVGMVLAWARVRTQALWFPIGLHAGWILVFKGSNLLYQKVPGHPIFPWWVGDSLRSGLLPMAVLGLTLLVCRFAIGRFVFTPSSE